MRIDANRLLDEPEHGVVVDVLRRHSRSEVGAALRASA
jgi:hypothetical protein